MKFTIFNSKHLKAVKYSGAGAKKVVRRSYLNSSREITNISQYDLKLQKYKAANILNNTTFIY